MHAALRGICIAMVTSWHWHATLVRPTPLSSTQSALHEHEAHALTQPRTRAVHLKTNGFPTPVRHSWPFQLGLIIL